MQGGAASDPVSAPLSTGAPVSGNAPRPEKSTAPPALVMNAALPPLLKQLAQQRDLLAVLDAGAYGMSLASNYNSRPRAAEVLVDLLLRRPETVHLFGVVLFGVLAPFSGLLMFVQSEEIPSEERSR